MKRVPNLKQHSCVVNDTSELEGKVFTKGQIDYLFGWAKSFIENAFNSVAIKINNVTNNGC